MEVCIVLCLYVAILSFFLSAYMFLPFLALYVKELGDSYAEFAVVLSVTGFMISIIQSYVGYLSDKVGARFLVIGGGMISVLGFLLIGITYDKLLIIPLYLLFNIGMGILVPSVFTLISYQKTAKGNSFIPIYRSIQGAGVIIGPVVGGWFMGKSYRLNVMSGSILMMISILLFTLFQIPINNALKKRKKRNALILMGILSLIPCSLLLLNLPSYFTILIMGGIGLTVGSLFTFCTVLASEKSPEDKKGTFMGVFNTIMPLTDVISPVMVAFFIGINLKVPYAVAVILIVLFIILSGLLYANGKDIIR